MYCGPISISDLPRLARQSLAVGRLRSVWYRASIFGIFGSRLTGLLEVVHGEAFDQLHV